LIICTQICILTQVLWNNESFLPSNITNWPSSQIISLCLPCLDHCFISNGFVFWWLKVFVVYECHTITYLWGCHTCEALGNEPLVWNIVSIMKWSVAKDNGCIWTMKLYLTISTAVCCWRSRLLKAFIDQLLIHSLFQISVSQVMIYVYTVYDLTSTRKITCKGILKNSKLKCDALVMVIFCAQCVMYTDNNVKWQSQPIFPLYCLTDCFRFGWNFMWGVYTKCHCLD
jgi:hypothetical protein